MWKVIESFAFVERQQNLQNHRFNWTRMGVFMENSLKFTDTGTLWKIQCWHLWNFAKLLQRCQSITRVPRILAKESSFCFGQRKRNQHEVIHAYFEGISLRITGKQYFYTFWNTCMDIKYLNYNHRDYQNECSIFFVA